MLSLKLPVAALMGAVAVMPATAVTYVTGGATSVASSVSITPSGSNNTLTLSAVAYLTLPTFLSNTSQFVGSVALGRSSVGIGACSEGGSPVGNGSDCAQVDSAGLFNEAMRLSFESAVSMTSLRLSMVDTNDTLRIYGLGSGGKLDLIGYGGNIANGLDQYATTTYLGSQNGGTYNINFNPTSLYATYFLTQNRAEGDGFRIDSIGVGPTLPEPATWVLMLGGFGFIGARARRRSRAVAA